MNNKYRPDYAGLYPDVEMSPEVLAFLKQSDRKLEYMERDLKRERHARGPDGRVTRNADGAPVILPEREDSLERLMRAGVEFPDAQPLPEDVFFKGFALEELRRALDLLDSGERALIEALFFERLTEHEYADSSGLTQQGVNKRRKKILAKLKNFIENF
jgi:RNA polymerase sigma factor (sigma-70 family)